MSSSPNHLARNCLVLLLALQFGPTTRVAARPLPVLQGMPMNAAHPQELFQQGEAALRNGMLDQAESSFRGVLAIDPQATGAYANLGVIYMRRKQWKPALEMLHHAERLAPRVPGIRLNIGLAFYRQADYRSAIAPFESVLHDADSAQARYLLGLCYFFTQRYPDAATTLEPLWPQQSNNLSFLYVLGIAANQAKRAALEDRALGRLVEVGQNSAEFHLLMGKALINRAEYEGAIKELHLAEDADAKLPFVHFNLGLAYLKNQNMQAAQAEFLRDIAQEPDLSDNYTELGILAYLQQRDEEAGQNFRRAIKLNPQDANAHFQLAKVLERQRKYSAALAELDVALKLAPQNQSVHYVRGRVLQRLGRAQEAKIEMTAAGSISNQALRKTQKDFEDTPLPSPELVQEPQ